jgi:hypothetical protein
MQTVSSSLACKMLAKVCFNCSTSKTPLAY